MFDPWKVASSDDLYMVAEQVFQSIARRIGWKVVEMDKDMEGWGGSMQDPNLIQLERTIGPRGKPRKPRKPSSFSLMVDSFEDGSFSLDYRLQLAGVETDLREMNQIASRELAKHSKASGSEEEVLRQMRSLPPFVEAAVIAARAYVTKRDAEYELVSSYER